MIIKKKTWKEAFEKILSGEKTFDIRLANFKCKPGDVLSLEEYDPVNKNYTGRKIEKEITYVLNTKNQNYWSQEEINKFGLQIISLK